MGLTKTTRSISATGLLLLIMMTVGLYSCTRTQKDITRNGRKGHVGLDKPVKSGHAFTHINIMLAQIIMHAIG